MIGDICGILCSFPLQLGFIAGLKSNSFHDVAQNEFKKWPVKKSFNLNSLNWIYSALLKGVFQVIYQTGGTQNADKVPDNQTILFMNHLHL